MSVELNETSLHAPERKPIVELLVLAAPTIAQMASYTVMQFIDRLMLARVGDLEAAAAGAAGMTYFSVLGFGFGVLLVVNTLVSQSFGRKDLSLTGQYLWQGVWFGLIFGLLPVVVFPFARQMFAAMGHEAQVAQLEGDYFRIVALAGWAKLSTMAMAEFLIGLHRPFVVMCATITGIVVNCLFNWLLIFGHWGFPAMGIVGSAWGLNAAVFVEFLVLAAYVSSPMMRRTFNTLDWQLRWSMLRTLLRVGLPAGFQLVCDIVAWTLFMNVIVASFGTAAWTANSFAFTYMHVSFMPAIGVGAAVTAQVGKYIGMKRYDLAEKRAHLGFFVVLAYMLSCGVFFFIFRNDLMRAFSSDPEVIKIGATLLMFVAGYQFFDAMFIIYVGALRGAGDTLVPAVTQVILVWTVVIGGGALAAKFFPQFGVSGPWTLATVFGCILGIYLLTRFRGGHWKTIRLDENQSSDRLRGFEVTSAIDAAAAGGEPGQPLP